MRLIAAGLAGCIAIGLAECGLRLLEIGFPQIYATDQFCGSRLRAGSSGWWTSEGHGYVSINRFGLRGPETTIEKPDGVTRIAVLGDSFMEALQVDWEQSFCGQLESLLNLEHPDKQCGRVEVLNFGVSGYGTAQELLMLKHYVWQFSPDIVLLGFFPENDIRNNSRSLEQNDTKPYFELVDGGLTLDASFLTSVAYVTANSGYEQNKATIVNRSNLLQVLKEAKRIWSLRRSRSSSLSSDQDNPEARLASAVNSTRHCYAEPATQEEQLAWKVTERLLAEMHVEVTQHAAKLHVFTISTPLSGWPNHKTRAAVLKATGLSDSLYAERRLRASCKNAGISMIPLGEQMLKHARDADVYLHGFDNSGLGFGHWNAAGHKVAAKIVAEALLSQ